MQNTFQSHFGQRLALSWLTIAIIALACTFAACTDAVGNTSKKAITAFAFANPNATGVIDESTHAIEVKVPADTDLTNLVPIFSFAGASISPLLGTANDFSSPVNYTVTAIDASTQAYRVTVSKTGTAGTDDITNITVSSGVLAPAFDQAILNYAIRVANSTPSFTALAVNGRSSIILYSPAMRIALTGTDKLIISVVKADASTKDYTLTVISQPGITYLPNGGVGNMGTQIIKENTSANLWSNSFTKQNYDFDGWALSANGPVSYANSAPLGMGSADISLYAHWIGSLNQVSFAKACSGFAVKGISGTMASQAIRYHETATLSTNSYSRTGYTFIGWLEDAYSIDGNPIPNNSSYRVDNNDPILYAVWSTNTAYSLGSTGPEGGTIFYDKGDYRGGWRYLEVRSTAIDSSHDWSGMFPVTSTERIIGAGARNTQSMVSGFVGATSPVELIADFNQLATTSHDWFLPSRDELDSLFHNFPGKIDSTKKYWSSSLTNATSCAVFDGASQSWENKAIFGSSYDTFVALPVRRF